jgi:hypothetical protein
MIRLEACCMQLSVPGVGLTRQELLGGQWQQLYMCSTPVVWGLLVRNQRADALSVVTELPCVRIRSWHTHHSFFS